MKIAICIPHLGTVEAMTAVALSGLTYFTARNWATAPLQVFEFSSGNLPGSRTKLAQRSLEWGASHILYIDADMVFAPDTLIRLAGRKLDFVAANCAVRGTPTRPTARTEDGGFIFTTDEKTRAGTLEEAHRVGMGLCLVTTDAIRKAGFPLFGNVALPGGTEFEGEDHFFCDRLRAAGVRIMIDHGVSASVGHIHRRILTSADTITDQKAFAAKMADSASPQRG